MSLDGLRLLPAVAFAALLLIAAVWDIRERRIPNWTVAAMIAAFVAAAALGLAPQGWVSSLAAFAIALVGSGLLYAFRAFGAGDSKLFSAAALFLGLGNLLMLTCATAIAGGVLALGFMIFGRRSSPPGRAEEGTSSGIPYGVAIAVGGMVTAAYAGILWSPWRGPPVL